MSDSSLFSSLQGHDPEQEEILRVGDGEPADPGVTEEPAPDPPKKSGK